jgi:predicted Zn-dependent protease
MREARLLLADLELGLKDWGGAAAAISAARRLPGGGDDPYAASRRALALIEAREAPQALAEIRRAYRQQPASEAASYAYAQSLRLAGKQAAAKQLQRKARDLATAGITAR